MIWLLTILLAPIAAIVIILTLRRAVRTVASAGAGLSFIGAWLSSGSETTLTLPGLPGMPLLLQSSPTTIAWSITVALVAGLITVYAGGYFAKDTRPARFFATFLGFIAAMQLFIFSGDYILLLVAWELMTLTSFLLIAHDYREANNGRAAVRAFITTRGGDLALYTAAFLVIIAAGSSELPALGTLQATAASIAGILIAVAAGVKAAQVPFGGWLRDAMAGPTPVSALLHSSAMVAAGALLLLKVSPWLSPAALVFIAVVGGLTAIIAGMVAVCQKDFKRLLAASTSSQIGFMFIAIGAGAPAAAALHFTAHALMKSSLFMGAGIFQHAKESTAFSRLAGIGKTQKPAFLSVAVAGLALAGLPPLAGFWSKDSILAATEHIPILFGVTLLASLITGMYVAVALKRLWQGAATPAKLAGRRRMVWPLVTMATLAAIFGLFLPLLERPFGSFPSTSLSMAADAGAALLGIIVGWYVTFDFDWVARLRSISERNFIENMTVRFSDTTAAWTRTSEAVLESGVVKTGRFGMRVAGMVQTVEISAIQSFFALGPALKKRSLAGLSVVQTGLVHQEIAMSIAAALVIGAATAVIVILGGV